MIISFAWTTLAVIANNYDPPGKTETRRDWAPKTIAQWRALRPRYADAWDKSPRFGGKCFGRIRVLEVRSEEIFDMPESAWYAEGFDRLQSIGAKIGKETAASVWKYWSGFRGVDPATISPIYETTQTVLVFELADLNEYGHKLWCDAVGVHGLKLLQRAPVPVLEGLPEGWRGQG